MVNLGTELLYLNLEVGLLNLKQSLLQNLPQFPLQYLLPILRNPNNVVLVMI